MLSLVLCQAKTDVPVAKAISISETRTKPLEKENVFFGPQSNLYLQGKLSGQAVKDAVKYGNLKMTEAVDDQKTDLILKKDPNTFSTTDQPDYNPIRDFERDQKTKDDLRFSINLKAPPRTAKKVSIKGSIDLLSGTPTTLEVEKAKSLEGTELKSPELEALKLKATFVKPGKNFFGKPDQVLMIKFDGDERPIMEQETFLVDGKGKKLHEAFGVSWEFRQPDTKEKSRTLWISCNGPIPADAKLQLKFLKAPKVTTVPFEFKDIELP